MGKKVRKILIAAAGRGTRLLPITSAVPKEMLPVIDKPVFQYVLEEALVAGIEEVILVINKQKKVLLEYIKNGDSPNFKQLLKKIKLRVVYQKGKLYGDAVPVMAAKKFLQDGPFLVLWADSFSLPKYSRIKKMIDSYKRYGASVLSLIPIAKQQTNLYAVPQIEGKNKDVVIIKRLLQKPGPKRAPSLLSAPNGYILNPDIFNYLKNFKPNSQGELTLIDAIDLYCQDKDVYGVIFRKPFYDAGNRVDYVKATLGVALERPDLKKFLKINRFD